MRRALLIAMIGVFNTSYAEVSGTDDEQHDAVHDHSYIGRLSSPNIVVFIQAGSFNCPIGDHRVIYLDSTDHSIYIGCLHDEGNMIRIIMENGKKIDIDKNAIDKKEDASKLPSIWTDNT